MKIHKRPSYYYSLLASCLMILIATSCGETSSNDSSSDDIGGSIGQTTITTDDCFTLDYIHPDTACQKVMANLVIDALNTKFLADSADKIQNISYASEDTITQQSKITTLGINKVVVLGDSLTSGYKQVTKSSGTNIIHYFTTDSYGIMLAKSLGLTTGTTDDSEFRYPDVDNQSTTESVAASISRGTIKNVTNTNNFHLLGFPKIPLVSFLDTNFTQTSALANATSNTTLQNAILLWKQVLRGQTADNPVTQMAALVPDLLVINGGNNDLLGPAIYENLAMTATSDFTTYYGGIIATAKAANPDVKMVFFKVADVAGSPYFDLKTSYTHLVKLLGTSVGALATIFSTTLYGRNDDDVGTAGAEAAARAIDLTKDKVKLGALTNLLLGKGTSEATPLDDADWLSETEYNALKARYAEYNAAIDALAAANSANAVVVDTAADLRTLTSTGSVTKN